MVSGDTYWILLFHFIAFVNTFYNKIGGKMSKYLQSGGNLCFHGKKVEYKF